MPSEGNRHMLVLCQFSDNKYIRCYLDYDSISQGLEGICRRYELEPTANSANSANSAKNHPRM
eukprot:gene334-453_t